MFDAKIRPYIDVPLNKIAQKLHSAGISANMLTCAGFLLGLCAFTSLATESYIFAFIFIVLSRVMDGLDGLVARMTSATDLGGYLDIVSDFIFYAGCIFFFAVGRPEDALVAAFLLFSFMGTGSSFLAYAILAAKHKVIEHEKSFFYLGGLTEGTETIFMLLALCVFPDYFVFIASLFGLMCWFTTYGRVRQAVCDFKT